MLMQLGGISDAEALRYETDYSSFEAKVTDYYTKLHERVRRIGTAAAIDYFVRNDSGVGAQGLRIEFNLEGTGSLLAEREDAAVYIGSFEMPKPPKEPRGAIGGYLDATHPYIPGLQDAMRPRDPIAFYWFERPKIGAKHSAVQCQDFRATRELRDSIFVLLFDELPVELSLRLHVSAANLPAPVNVSAKLVISEEAVEWTHPVVRGILPDRIGELLA